MGANYSLGYMYAQPPQKTGCQDDKDILSGEDLRVTPSYGSPLMSDSSAAKLCYVPRCCYGQHNPIGCHDNLGSIIHPPQGLCMYIT